MPIVVDPNNELILVTSPTTDVTYQELHDAIEDWQSTPVGLSHPRRRDGSLLQLTQIFDVNGKLEDPSNPGIFTQIILQLHDDWQIQFWAGSGYTRLSGGKLFGGKNGQPILATTGPSSDITVIESQVDGILAKGGYDEGDRIMLRKIYKFLGLDPSQPITHTQIKISTPDGDVDIDITGDQENTSTLSAN